MAIYAYQQIILCAGSINVSGRTAGPLPYRESDKMTSYHPTNALGAALRGAPESSLPPLAILPK